MQRISLMFLVMIMFWTVWETLQRYKVVKKEKRPRCSDGSLDMRYSVNQGLQKHGYITFSDYS